MDYSSLPSSENLTSLATETAAKFGGCGFSGNVASSTPAPGIFTGTIVAAGCTDAIITGNFAATASREDANGLELELEREAETNGERVKVKIKARLSKQ